MQQTERLFFRPYDEQDPERNGQDHRQVHGNAIVLRVAFGAGSEDSWFSPGIKGLRLIKHGRESEANARRSP